MIDRPFFTVIEGPEKAGKSTLIRYLKKRLGKDLYIARMPGTTELGEELRRILSNPEIAIEPYAQAQLFIAGHRQFLIQELHRAAESHKYIVVDRMDLSTLIYQTAAFAQLSAEQRRHLGLWRTVEEFYMALQNQLAMTLGSFPRNYIILDASDETLNQRLVSDESQERFECQSNSFHGHVRRLYREKADELVENDHAILISNDKEGQPLEEDRYEEFERGVAYIESHPT